MNSLKTFRNAFITIPPKPRGSPQLNMALSQQRANVVKNMLVQNGVPADAVTTAASGDTGLLVDTGPQANQPKNRRVVIVIQQ